ncbi:phage minor capsid protein [Sutcliffiella horikoshii]|uniref:phage minor capsid protein n=1 Tax=Sutcliffiella horikoshii TaxID=79883 RepID=UPI00203C4829|nr:phage minor capsid protein [Sutcliffiella horikoshii]MCM3620501.1 phage minor capsid protein [Sutcliffiella horikoshii]
MPRPKITPHQLDLWSSNMSELYNSLEGEIIRIIIRRLSKGSNDITSWQAQKLLELRLFNAEVAKLISSVTSISEMEISRMFEEAGKDIINDIDKAMPYSTKPVPTNLDDVMRAYSNQASKDIDNYVNQSLITTQYGIGSAQVAYQSILNQTSALFNSGIETFEQALERSITDLVQRGIRTTLKDKGGNSWSLEGYTRTVLKSTLSNTYNQLRTERMAEYGVHTVLVTSHVGAREACSHIQGNVVDLRPVAELPEGSEFKSIYDESWSAKYGEAGGHRGVNCKHLHIPFIPGINTNNQPLIDPALNQKILKARDTQRRIEREIVKYKKNLMVAEELGSEKANHWREMVRRRQAAMRLHLNTNVEYLRRNYKREKVYTPLAALLEDFSYED